MLVPIYRAAVLRSTAGAWPSVCFTFELHPCTKLVFALPANRGLIPMTLLEELQRFTGYSRKSMPAFYSTL